MQTIRQIQVCLLANNQHRRGGVSPPEGRETRPLRGFINLVGAAIGRLGKVTIWQWVKCGRAMLAPTLDELFFFQGFQNALGIAAEALIIGMEHIGAETFLFVGNEIEAIHK